MSTIDDKRLNVMIDGMKLYADMPYGVKVNEFSAKDLYSAMVELRELRVAKQWVSVVERLPENKVDKYGIIEPTVVLCTNGKAWCKAYYVKQHEFDCETMGYFDGDTDFDDETGKEYWPEGWYECSSENDDTDWVLGAKITHWMLLPTLPGTGEGAK